ncbi:MAG: hypothetical protein FPO08_04495 [Geobacter sp.]|nr:MAG: hypothetical protein FPO08_04495 [Geobacter sp.]
MSNRTVKRDKGLSTQQGLFDSGLAEGSLDIVLGLKQCLSRLLRGHDRYLVAAQISRATLKEISKDTLDKVLSSDTAYQPSAVPPAEHCRKLATSAPVTRVPNEKLQISFENRDYQLKAPALKQVKVNLDYTPWDPDTLNVWTDAGECVPCRLIRRNEHGFDVEAPVFGEDEFKRHADTPAQKIRHDFENRDKATRLNGFEPKPTACLVPDITFLPRKGVEILPTELPKSPPIKASEVPGKLRRDLNLERVTPIMRQQVEQWLGAKEELSSAAYEILRDKAQVAWKVSGPATTTQIRNASVFNGAIND